MVVSIDRPNGSFTLKISVTGQAVSLGTPFPQGLWQANRIDVQALVGNAHPIIIGDYQITQDQTNGGILLNVLPISVSTPAQPDTYNLELTTCLQTIFINGYVGDGVSVNWWRGDRN